MIRRSRDGHDREMFMPCIRLPIFDIQAFLGTCGALVLLAACGDGPTTVPGAPESSPRSVTGSANENAATVSFELLSYTEVDGGVELDLTLQGLDAVGIASPDRVEGIDLPTRLEQLQFFAEEGKDDLVEGPGLITVSGDDVQGFGRLVDVPVTGFRKTDPFDPGRPVGGTLTIDLTEDVVAPAQGDFFVTCGFDCIQFRIEATLQETGVTQPSPLSGTFILEVGGT